MGCLLREWQFLVLRRMHVPLYRCIAGLSMSPASPMQSRDLLQARAVSAMAKRVPGQQVLILHMNTGVAELSFVHLISCQLHLQLHPVCAL